MRVAVCLSGQPRTVRTALPSLKRYFSAVTPDYFCHAWRQNSWKNPDPRTSTSEPADDRDFEFIRAVLEPKLFQISDPSDSLLHTQSMFRSMALANMLRRSYEIEAGVRYDLIVKARYDIAFPAGRSFSPTPPPERTLFTNNLYRLPHEYRRLNFSDVMFFGDPWGMDIAADYMFEQPAPVGVDENRSLGPGTGLADYLLRNNVNCIGISPEEVIIRKEAAHLDPIQDWDEIHRIHWSYYQR